MAYSYVDYPTMGVGQTKSIPFPYLLPAHVEVTVEGTLVPSSLYQITGNQMVPKAGFPSGKGRIRRRTPLSEFGSVQTGTSALDWEGMTDNFEAVLYILQELIDSKDDNAVIVDGLLNDVAAVLPVATGAANSALDSKAQALAAKVAALAAQVLAETAAASAQASAASATMSASISSGASQTAQTASTQASALVASAVSGFLGFSNNGGYDFGSIADSVTYFNQDWGSI